MNSAAGCGMIVAGIGKDTAADNFDEVVRLYRPRVFRLAMASLRDRELAENVTQDCFLKAHRAWNSFRGEASLQTWLLQIAVNLVRDAARSRRFQFWKRALIPLAGVDSPSDWIPDRGSSPEAQASARQQVEAIWRGLRGLSQTQRTVFVLHFMEDMDAAEIETVTGVSKAAVKVHLFRAVRSIRKRMEGK